MSARPRVSVKTVFPGNCSGKMLSLQLIPSKQWRFLLPLGEGSLGKAGWGNSGWLCAGWTRDLGCQSGAAVFSPSFLDHGPPHLTSLRKRKWPQEQGTRGQNKG